LFRFFGTPTTYSILYAGFLRCCRAPPPKPALFDSVRDFRYVRPPQDCCFTFSLPRFLRRIVRILSQGDPLLMGYRSLSSGFSQSRAFLFHTSSHNIVFFFLFLDGRRGSRFAFWRSHLRGNLFPLHCFPLFLIFSLFVCSHFS